MKSSLLHEQTASSTIPVGLCYELDAERYPSLGNEFFTQLREKYPRAFRRTVVCDAGKSSVRSSTTPEGNKSVWSLWDCDGDDSKAVLMEAGGMLIPRCDLAVHERLKHISDSFSSAKLTGNDLLITLKSFRSTLLADDSDSLSFQHVTENIDVAHNDSVIAHDTSYRCTDDASESVSRNSSCEKKSLRDLPKGKTVSRVSSDQSVSCDMQPGVVDAVSETDAILNGHSTERKMMLVQSVDVNTCNTDIKNTLVEEDAENHLPSAGEARNISGDNALPVEHDQADTDQGLVKSV